MIVILNTSEAAFARPPIYFFMASGIIMNITYSVTPVAAPTGVATMNDVRPGTGLPIR